MRSLLQTGAARKALRGAQYAFAVVGVLALGYCLEVSLSAKFYQGREARNFAEELRGKESAQATLSSAVTRRTAPADGSVVGKLDIPHLGVSVMVVEGVNDSDLNRAVGHIPGTALPGEPGNVGIAGHRDTFFRPLRSIRLGDMIALDTLKESYRYRVVSTAVVRPEDIQVLDPTGRDSLTLVTCFPFNYIGSAPKRFIVRAERTPGI